MTEQEINLRIEELLKKLTLKEKVGQLCQMYLTDKSAPDVIAAAKEGLVSSVVLTGTAFAGNSNGTTDIDKDAMEGVQKAALASNSGIPVLFGKDVIHGYRTIFPIPLGQAASFDPELVKEAASRMSAEAARSGIQWTYAPMLDLARDPRWGRIIESFGEDPYLAGVLGAASVEGIQGDDMSRDDKIVACAKHFVGYGAAEGGRDYNKSEITDYTLRNMYLPAFKKAVDAGIQTFMNNFGDIGGDPCVFSEYLFRDILRKEWGFDGFVVSDWGSVCNPISKGAAEDKRECAERALHAGIDMEMVSTAYIEHLEELVASGEMEMSVIDEAVANVLRVKLRCGLFDKPMLNLGDLDIYHPDDMDFSYRAAAESMVLLKNENNVLPLASDARIFVRGPMAFERRSILGNWCPGATDEEVHPFWDTMKAAFPNAISASGNGEIDYGYHEALRNCDTIVLALGESWRMSGEGNAVSDCGLAPAQVALVKSMHALGKKVVLVIFAGKPVVLTDVLPYADAILYAWHPGTRGTEAATDILLGKINPSGRLPVSLLRATGQTPLYYNYPRAQHNYREYRDVLATPLYPFGYGLSYTEYAYSDLKVDTTELSLADIEAGKGFTVSVTVENTGKVDGKETVQMYVADLVARRTRPIRELRGFQKIALRAGEKQTVSFFVGKEELGYMPYKTFLVEPGDFTIAVGKDATAPTAFTVKVTK